jgi:MFS family permease
VGSDRTGKQERGAFGWKVVRAAFAVAVFSWGVGFYGPAVFLQTLHAERGWAIASISAAVTAHFLFSAGLVAYLPEAHRRFGIAPVTQAGIALSAVGVLAWASARQPWQLYPAALLSGAGWAATSGAAINAMVAPWFGQDRPKALSIAFNGASIGGVVFTPLWVALIAQLGFATAAALVGGIMVLTLWPLAARTLRPSPPGAANEGSAPGHQAAAAAPAITRAALLRDRRFVTLSGAFALGLFAQIGLFAHLLARLVPAFGTGGAAAAVSLTTVCAVVGRTLLGWRLGDRHRRLAAAGNFALQAAGTVLLMIGQEPAAILLGCMLFGLGVGNLISLPPLIAQKEFRPGDVGTVIALITAINQAVFAFAPAVLGAMRDLAGGYALPFALAAAIQCLAAVLVLVHRAHDR